MSGRAFCIVGCALALIGACKSGEDEPVNGNNAGTGVTGAAGGGAGTSGPPAGNGGGNAGSSGGGMSGSGSGSGSGGSNSSTAGSSGSPGMSGSGGAPVMGGECATDEDKRTGAMCAENANGIFAIKTVVDVWWQDDAEIPLVDSGRGNITVYLMGTISDVCDDGSGGVGIMKGCGTELPAFRSVLNCDVFQIEFPDELWDQPTMPTFTTTGSTTGFEPGDMLTIATATGLVGISLQDENGTWPDPAQTTSFPCAAGTGAECFPDHDGDGKPGITIRMGKIGMELTHDGCGGFNLPWIYRGAPLDPVNGIEDESIRADKLQIGLRTRLGGGGAINADCASGSGDSVAEFLDSRVLDCQRTDGMNCAPAESTFVDESAPTYNIIAKGAAPPTTVMTPDGAMLDQTPGPGPRSALVRLGNIGEPFTCADVRNAPYPEL